MSCGSSVLKLLVLFLLISPTAQAQGDGTPKSGVLRYKRGDPGSFADRLLQFDTQLNVWILGLEFPKTLGAEADKTLRECFEQRKKSHAINRRPLSAILRTEHLDLAGHDFAKNLLDKHFGVVPRTVADADAHKTLLTNYFKAEVDAETLLAEQISEILNPAQQFEFFSKPATMDSFLVHPIGEIYLKLSKSQKAALHKQFQLRHSLADARLRSPAQMKAIDEAKEQVEAGKRNLNIRVPSPTIEEIKARMQLFAILDKEQLLQFLRLNRSIKPNQQVDDWIKALKGEDRRLALAEEVL
jgi:hypothetical protein